MELNILSLTQHTDLVRTLFSSWWSQLWSKAPLRPCIDKAEPIYRLEHVISWQSVKLLINFCLLSWSWWSDLIFCCCYHSGLQSGSPLLLYCCPTTASDWPPPAANQRPGFRHSFLLPTGAYGGQITQCVLCLTLWSPTFSWLNLIHMRRSMTRTVNWNLKAPHFHFCLNSHKVITWSDFESLCRNLMWRVLLLLSTR